MRKLNFAKKLSKNTRQFCMSSFNMKKFIENELHNLKPPVANKLMFNGKQLKVMIVGGPNQRDDFHVEEGEELFIQLNGKMELHTMDNKTRYSIPIQENHIYLLPARVPHSPQRYANTVGLVIERARLSHEQDKLQWYSPQSGKLVHQDEFHCTNLGTQLKPIIEQFFASDIYKKEFLGSSQKSVEIIPKNDLNKIRIHQTSSAYPYDLYQHIKQLLHKKIAEENEYISSINNSTYTTASSSSSSSTSQQQQLLQQQSSSSSYNHKYQYCHTYTLFNQEFKVDTLLGRCYESLPNLLYGDIFIYQLKKSSIITLHNKPDMTPIHYPICDIDIQNLGTHIIHEDMHVYHHSHSQYHFSGHDNGNETHNHNKNSTNNMDENTDVNTRIHNKKHHTVLNEGDVCLIPAIIPSELHLEIENMNTLDIRLYPYIKQLDSDAAVLIVTNKVFGPILPQ